jgi:hypothetical protein
VGAKGCNLNRNRFDEVAANDRNYNRVIIPVWQGSGKSVGIDLQKSFVRGAPWALHWEMWYKTFLGNYYDNVKLKVDLREGVRNNHQI